MRRLAEISEYIIVANNHLFCPTGDCLKVGDEILLINVRVSYLPPEGTPTATSTPTPTTTPTSTPSGDFPATSILDDFNRADGPVGSNWNGNTYWFTIASNQGTITNFSSAVWMPETFGADQEAYITLAHVDPNGDEQDLLLKETDDGLIEVLYSAEYNDVGVWTYSDAQGWVLHGNYIPVTFNDGDQFGARALANGDVEVYKNGVLIGVRNVSSWQYHSGGGRIGVWFVEVTGALLDDFGGGTINGGEGLMAQDSGFVESGSSETGDLLQTLQTLPKPTRTPLSTSTPTLTPTVPPPAAQGAGPNFAPVSFKLPAPARDIWNQTLETLTIDYTYDALHRLTSATYSDGRSFGYTYDPAGNVLELQQNLGPGTVTTLYTYDTANQLTTAQQGSTSWQYTYDANGSLISDGVKTYTYDSANRLVQVSEQSTVTSLSYNGLGQRLSMDPAGVTAQYVLDGDRPLTAESNGNTTFYLYDPSAGSRQTRPPAQGRLQRPNIIILARLRRILALRYNPCKMKTARYFEEQVLRKRPYLKREWCEEALRNPARREIQPDGRIRQWIFIEELNKYLRVVTLEDGETVLNAFPDRNFEV